VQCHGPAEPRAWAEQARRAEDLGYATLTVADHLDDAVGPTAALMAAADATTTLRLGVLVFCNDYRHPAVLARDAATLDLLSDGRLELGIGAGWKAAEYEAGGIPFDRPGARIDRLADAVVAVKAALGGGPVDHTGDHYRFAGLVTGPPATQRPHPPILIGGGGRRVLSLAAREADIVGLNIDLRSGAIDETAGPTATDDATDRKVRWIAEAAGDRLADLELHTRIHLALVSDDRDAVAEAVAPSLGLTPDQSKHSPHALVGTFDEMAAQCHEWRDRWGISAIGLSADALEPLAPLVARLAGT
jgi:probable F420-dependent oxidoreductase